MEFRFENTAAFQLLWVIPVVMIMVWYLTRRHWERIKRGLGERLTPFLTASISTSKRRWKLILEIVVLTLFVLALARPQSGESKKKVKSEGIEILLLVDVSQSMLAEDAKPSRLELAKKELSNFIDLLEGDRVALVAFAGSAVLLSPLTPDRPALKMFLDSLSTETVSTQGTEFKKALEESSGAFTRGGIEAGKESVVTKAVVIVSDGEDNEPGAMEVAEGLAKKGIRIFTLGIGTEKGAPIPVRDKYGYLRGYKKDRSGKTVMSTTKGTVLKSLAAQGKGSFYHMTFGGNAVRRLYDDIKKLERSEFASSEVVDYEEHYQWILFLALILLAIELLLSDRRGPLKLWKGRFEVVSR